jgi:hypothetical protein
MKPEVCSDEYQSTTDSSTYLNDSVMGLHAVREGVSQMDRQDISLFGRLRAALLATLPSCAVRLRGQSAIPVAAPLNERTFMPGPGRTDHRPIAVVRTDSSLGLRESPLPENSNPHCQP